MKASLLVARKKLTEITNQWVDADRECRETYKAWQAACRRREELVIKKRNAWGDFEMERVRSGVHQQLEAKT